jgi:hypothetical protein
MVLRSELKVMHDFVRSIADAKLPRSKKLELTHEEFRRRAWKELGLFWERLTSDMAEQLASSKAWTPAEKAKEYLAPKLGYTVNSFSRFVVESSPR